jgi:hypothetical protein
MANRELRDNHGKLLGTIKILSSGKYELRDSHGLLKGHYDPKVNETRDAHGKLVAKGDMLTTLL